MAEVLRSSIKHDGKVFEAGSPASDLPKGVRETARNNGFLVPGPKKAKAKAKAKAEPEAPETEEAPEEETEAIDEPDSEE